MSRNLDIGLLRTFVTVADCNNMTVAANALHMTQSAVSQQVSRLEQQTGQLFVRKNRTLHLTNQAERLLVKARKLITFNDELWAEVTDKPVMGMIKLGAPYDLVSTILPPVLKEFTKEYPLVEIELLCLPSPELKKAIENSSIDLALIEEPLTQANAQSLLIDRLVWVGAKAGKAHLKRPVPISIVSDTCAFRPIVLQALADHSLSWRTIFESGSFDATRATVRCDLAITACLASTVPDDLEVLAFDSYMPPLPSFSVNFYQAKTPLSKAAIELSLQIKSAFTS